jgi:hypothetical protein
VIGRLVARRAGTRRKDYYAQQIARCGLLLRVRCATPEKQRLARRIMEGHSGRDVHVHAWSEP